MTHGSRAVGIFSSSTSLTVVPVVILRSSRIGLSAVTVIPSSTAELIATSTLELRTNRDGHARVLDRRKALKGHRELVSAR